jgi:DNA-binding MarR family transcriptional regulator
MSISELSLSEFLPYQLSVTSNAVSDLIARSYQGRFGLKIPEWRIMAVLGEKDSATQRELVTATAMDKVSVNRACKGLEGRALIGRAPNSADGRSHHLALTASGRQLYEQIVPQALALETDLLLTLNKEESEHLAQILLKLKHRADEMTYLKDE